MAALHRPDIRSGLRSVISGVPTWFQCATASSEAAPLTALVEWLTARKPPGTSAATNCLTISCAWSVRGMWCKTPSRARFPFGLDDGVLDLAVLGAFDDVGSLVRGGAHQGQAALLHDAPGRGIARHRVPEHPLDAQVGESHADQGTRPLGRVALVPRGPAQPVAQVDVGDIGAGPARKWNQPRNSPVAADSAAQVPSLSNRS